ncbi:transposase [Streptomyces sp. NPDC090114]|uniref:transposase n=1 Tax=Streptomyces sp. NPDC090114 TaxID=3365950 RepID=UPI00380A53CA
MLPRRWVVERSFAWCLRSRRLVRDYERRTDTSEAVILWSMTMLMSRRLPPTASSVALRQRGRQREPARFPLYQPASFHQPLQPCPCAFNTGGRRTVPAQHYRRPSGTKPVASRIGSGGHQRLVVRRQFFYLGRVSAMRHRPARSDRLPPRHLTGHVGGCVLLGQRLQVLFQADHRRRCTSSASARAARTRSNSSSSRFTWTRSGWARRTTPPRSPPPSSGV